MIPLSLTLKNFLCYRSEAPTLHLEGVHVACLCGPNGHGKSALLDAMTWALWGEARGRRQDDLIYHGEREMQVALEFEARETRYRVVRRHARGTPSRPGQSSLELLVSTGNGLRPITGNSVAETQRHIHRLLNMDYPTFVNSAFLVQGRADEFTRATPAQRKEVLARVLGLGLYDRLEARARSEAREKQAEARSLELEMERLSQEAEGKGRHLAELAAVHSDLSRVEREAETTAAEVEAARRSLGELRSRQAEMEAVQRQVQERQRHLSALEAQANKRGARIQEYRQKAGQIPRLQAELDRARAERDALDQEEEALKPHRERLQDMAAEAHRLRSENTRLMEEMRELRAKVDMLQREGESPRCPLCNSPLGAQECQHLAGTYESQGKEKKQAYLANEAAIRKVEDEVRGGEAQVNRREQDLRQRRRQGEAHVVALEKELHEANLSHGLIASDEEALEADARLIESGRRAQEEARTRQSAIQADLQHLPILERQLQERDEAHKDLLGRRDALREQRSVLADRIRRCEEAEKALAVKDEALKAAQQQVGIYRDLAEALGRGGVQALIMEASTARLEEQANRLLARMTDHRMAVKLETQRERRTRPEADPVETLDIFVADELGTRDYQMFSGGEAFRINFALRIALSRLLAERAGAPLPTLFVDEGFGTQDVQGRERILDVIRAIQDDFKCILVITHMDEVKDAFPVRVEVSKGERGSTFTLV